VLRLTSEVINTVFTFLHMIAYPLGSIGRGYVFSALLMNASQASAKAENVGAQRCAEVKQASPAASG